jgi:3-deoxy-D-manno-octulosonate 8-phosphate phosphatase (KDO 8-P phosphatase)
LIVQISQSNYSITQLLDYPIYSEGFVSIEDKAARIKLLLFDVDGVLTDGKILLHADGSESKTFDIKDGTAIVWAQRLGLTVGFLSARTSAATSQRAAQLGITLLHQGVRSKLDTYDQIADSLLLDDEQVAYMGDDILDLPVLSRVGLAAAPSDAAQDVRTRVDWVSQCKGGSGAARELIETILRAQGRWDSVVATYISEVQDQKA